MRSRVLYEERSGWPPWVHFLVWLCCAACLYPALRSLGGFDMGDEAMSFWGSVMVLCLGLAFPLLIYGLLGQLRTRVLDDGILVVWGMAEVIKKRVSFQEILTVEPVTYSPLKEFGGWGIRGGAGKKSAWTVRGNQAVVLKLKDGTSLYVGSRHPSRLAERIRSGISLHQGRGEA